MVFEKAELELDTVGSFRMFSVHVIVGNPRICGLEPTVPLSLERGRRRYELRESLSTGDRELAAFSFRASSGAHVERDFDALLSCQG